MIAKVLFAFCTLMAAATIVLQYFALVTAVVGTLLAKKGEFGWAAAFVALAIAEWRFAIRTRPFWIQKAKEISE